MVFGSLLELSNSATGNLLRSNPGRLFPSSWTCEVPLYEFNPS